MDGNRYVVPDRTMGTILVVEADPVTDDAHRVLDGLKAGKTVCKRCHRGTPVQLDGLKFHGRSSSILLAG